MNALTLPRYLVGSQRAILDVATSRWSFWIGAIFVLSAGFAREYDGEDLVHEPWHALRPLAASLASGTALFLIVHLAALLKSSKAEGTRPGFFEAWFRFMGLFWMTAPMAWLYAVPYERFMTPVDAIRLNLWTLALVALWRVILMTRVVQVLYGIRSYAAFFLVMLFADAVVFVVLTTVPTPVIDVMGGIRQSERDALIGGVTLMVTLLAVLSAPVWIIGALSSIATLRPSWPDLSQHHKPKRSNGLLILAIASVLAFLPLLIVSQPEQINKREVELLLKNGDVPAALLFMSERSPEDFPPQWNPPPRLGYRESEPSLVDVRNAMTDDWPADWVATIYLDKIDRKLREEIMPFWSQASWEHLAEHLEAYPAEAKINAEHRHTAQFLHDHLPDLTEAEKSALKQIAASAESSEP